MSWEAEDSFLGAPGEVSHQTVNQHEFPVLGPAGASSAEILASRCCLQVKREGC